MTDCAWIDPEIEADGFITPLEQLAESRAKPMEECQYPKCEECDKYHGHYCTVPVVVSKQMLMQLEDFARRTNEKFWIMESRIDHIQYEVLGGQLNTEAQP